MKVLILDAANSNTLAIIRHVKRHDKTITFHVAGYSRFSLSFFSRYVSKKVMLPHHANQEKFIAALLQILQDEKYDLLMPVGFYTHEICVNHTEKIKKYTEVCLPPLEAFNTAASKLKTYQLAEKLLVPCPKTFNIGSIEEVNQIKTTFPAVIKAQMEMGKNVVEYVHSQKELLEKYAQMCDKNNFTAPNLPIVQEFIKGDGYGFFAYYDAGQCKRIFMHKRIREYPVTGGASTCAESFFDEKLIEYGEKLLDYLKWNGVTMVEFKKDEKTNTYTLMEINPKFWGSLELALAAGVNFPYFIIQKVKNEEVEFSDKFNKVRFQWVLNGELFHVIGRPGDFFAVIRDLFRSKKDLSWRDPLPNLFQVIMIPVHYYKKIKAKLR